MKWFQQTFTQRINAYHGQWGHLYQGRYKAIVIDDRDAAYFRTVGEYIHLNPVEAGMVNAGKPSLAAYAHSSYPSYLISPGRRPKWLEVRRLMAAVCIERDTVKGRRLYEAYMQKRTLWAIAHSKKLKEHPEWNSLRRGWCHGSMEFRERMLAYLGEQEGILGYDSIGRQQREYGEKAAEQALQRALRYFGLQERELTDLRKSDPRKMLIGGCLKCHFSVTNAWISERLKLGHRSTVSRAMHLFKNPPSSSIKDRKALLHLLQLSS